MKNTMALESLIRGAIEGAIWEYEREYDEDVLDIEMDVTLHIDKDGIQTLMVDVYD